MSRIGNTPIPIPDGVEVIFENNSVNVTGPKGSLQQQIHTYIAGEIKANTLYLSVKSVPKSDMKKARASHGLYRALIANMVTGVRQGFQKTLLIKGVGYRAELKESSIFFYLGYSTQIEYCIPPQITIHVEKNNSLVVQGIDKQLVGQVAAEIRSLRPVEPYKGKGIRYADEHVRQKAGKAGVK